MSKIKTWKERLQNTIYGYPEEMQCREDEVDELRTRIYQLEQELANVSEQLAEAKKDQARYRWIVRDFDTAKMKLEDYLYTDFESLDDFIDAAIKESK